VLDIKIHYPFLFICWFFLCWLFALSYSADRRHVTSNTHGTQSKHLYTTTVNNRMEVREMEGEIKNTLEGLELGSKVPKKVIDRATEILGIDIDYRELGEDRGNYVLETAWNIKELLEAAIEYGDAKEKLHKALSEIKEHIGKAWTDRVWKGSLTKKESRIAVKLTNLEKLLGTRNAFLLRALRKEHQRLLKEHRIKNVIVKRFKFGTWLFAIVPHNGIVDAKGLPREFIGFLINRKKQFGIKFVKT